MLRFGITPEIGCMGRINITECIPDIVDIDHHIAEPIEHGDWACHHGAAGDGDRLDTTADNSGGDPVKMAEKLFKLAFKPKPVQRIRSASLA